MRLSVVALSKRTRMGRGGGEKSRAALEAAAKTANPQPAHRMRHGSTPTPLEGLAQALDLPKRAEPPPPAAAPEPPAEKKLVLFTCDRQFAARMMPIASVVQVGLAVLHTSSQSAVKKGLAQADRLEQIRLGVENAMLLPWEHYMRWYDWGLTGMVWGAPLVLLLCTRWTTQRWIVSFALLPSSQCEVTTYNWIGQHKKRIVPLASVQRTATGKHLLIDGKHYLLHEKIGKYPDKSAFQRIVKVTKA
jgi:hypothetical protein